MTLAYTLRLVALCLASFFIVQVALGLIVLAVSPVAVRFSGRMRPGAAASFLLVLRLLPAAAGLLVVCALCLPSYLWFEPRAGAEEISLVCSFAALLGAALWIGSILRVGRAAAASSRRARKWRLSGRQFRLPENLPDILVVDDDAPVLALAGVFRPRLIASRAVLRQLSPDQLNAALRHEGAHRSARDNFKRLLLFLAPGAIPFVCGFSSLERAWSRCAEWAADDRAAAGDAYRSLSLAEALVSVSRMGASPQLSPLLSTLVPDDADLSARVNRLLQPVRAAQSSHRRMQAIAACGSFFAVAALLTILLQPATFFAVHRVLEHLVR